jgi:hypothetical protein
MKQEKGTFNVLSSIERHIEALQPLLPKQAMVAIGEYCIKSMLKEPTVKREGTLPIFVEKNSQDIYTWIPKGFDPYFVLGYEDARLDTHFWYDVHLAALKDNSIIEALKKKPDERLNSAIVFSSTWDGVGSATLPTLISKFKTSNINSLSLAVLPSKIQPPDAHFNAYAAVQLCQTTEGSTVLLLDRDKVESYEGVDRKGELLKGNMVVNYLLNLFLAKEALVSEISELSRTFDVKLFGGIVVTGASIKIYGSIENMLNAAWLKPLLPFELPSASLLYVLIRMPLALKEKLPRSKIELAVANWFSGKTSLQSIYVTEPVYTDDMTDRIDAVLFVGGFDTSTLFGELQKKVEALKIRAVEKGYMTEDWQVIVPKIEEPKPVEVELPPPPPLPIIETASAPEEVKAAVEAPIAMEDKTQESPAILLEPPRPVEALPAPLEAPKLEQEPKVAEKPKRTRKVTIKKAAPKRRKKTEKVEEQKQETPSA